jgi:hypothetical protein
MTQGARRQEQRRRRSIIQFKPNKPRLVALFSFCPVFTISAGDFLNEKSNMKKQTNKKPTRPWQSVQ